MKIKNGFMLRKLADNFVVVSINRKSNDFNGMIQLNSTGAFIWEQLQTDKTKEEFLGLVLDKYELTEQQAKKDIDLFIDKLRKDNLLDE